MFSQIELKFCGKHFFKSEQLLVKLYIIESGKKRNNRAASSICRTSHFHFMTIQIQLLPVLCKTDSLMSDQILCFLFQNFPLGCVRIVKFNPELKINYLLLLLACYIGHGSTKNLTIFIYKKKTGSFQFGCLTLDLATSISVQKMIPIH